MKSTDSSSYVHNPFISIYISLSVLHIAHFFLVVFFLYSLPSFPQPPGAKKVRQQYPRVAFSRGYTERSFHPRERSLTNGFVKPKPRPATLLWGHYTTQKNVALTRPPAHGSLSLSLSLRQVQKRKRNNEMEEGRKPDYTVKRRQSSHWFMAAVPESTQEPPHYGPRVYVRYTR